MSPLAKEVTFRTRNTAYLNKKPPNTKEYVEKISAKLSKVFEKKVSSSRTVLKTLRGTSMLAKRLASVEKLRRRLRIPRIRKTVEECQKIQTI